MFTFNFFRWRVVFWITAISIHLRYSMRHSYVLFKSLFRGPFKITLETLEWSWCCRNIFLAIFLVLCDNVFSKFCITADSVITMVTLKWQRLFCWLFSRLLYKTFFRCCKSLFRSSVNSFSNLFFRMVFRDSESLGKSNVKKWSQIWIFLFENCLKSPRKQNFFSSFFLVFFGFRSFLTVFLPPLPEVGCSIFF
jgi:hypothetical protein